jgi:hypothetical protein
MFLFKRFLSLLLAVSLMPFIPTHPVKADSSQMWSGEFTHVFDKYFYRILYPPRLGEANGRWDQRWIYTREFRLLGDGTAIQTTTYSETLKVTDYSMDTQFPFCYGDYQAEYFGSSTEIIPSIDVELNENYLDVFYPTNSLTAYRTSEWDDCWETFGIGDSLSMDTSKVILEFTRPWFHQGAFTTDDLVVSGRDVWSEQTWNTETTTSRDIQTKFTSYRLTREKDNTWLPQWTKDYLTHHADVMQYGGFVLAAGEVACFFVATCPEIGVPLALIGLGMEGRGWIDRQLALDPIDPNYTEIAIPVTPILNQQPILAGVYITQVQADAINALLNNIEQEIGLGQAMLTTFDRASGALAANDSIWVSNQLQAARNYAGQVANILDARPILLVALKEALQTYPDMPLILTGEDVAKYKYNLATLGFSTDQTQIFTDLGMDDRAISEILDAQLLTKFPPGLLPNEEVGRFPDVLTDPDLIESIHNLAYAMREFSLGRGWKSYIPLLSL